MLDFTDVIAYWYWKNHVVFTWSFMLLAKFPHFVLMEDLGVFAEFFFPSEITQLLYIAAICRFIPNIFLHLFREIFGFFAGITGLNSFAGITGLK